MRRRLLDVSGDPCGCEVEASMIHALLLRYRVLAFTTATLLIVLVFVGLPLQLLAHRPAVVNDVGTIHGLLYLVYLYFAFQLTRKLGVPKWQMCLVLLAGTVPFCAFVAERKMTRRVAALGSAEPVAERRSGRTIAAYAARVRRRWFSRRAVLLHLAVAVVAPGCLAAGWWQATRALAGNGLSWVYSVEWPAFAVLAVAGWWHLLHEDPEAYRMRKQRGSAGAAVVSSPADGAGAHTPAETVEQFSFDGISARLATLLAVTAGIELVLGMVTLALVPFGRPSGWQPSKGTDVYLLHAVLGLPLALGAVLLLVRTRRSARLCRLGSWIGAVGVTIAGAGGLLTSAHPLRLEGMAFMLVGGVTASFGYLFPVLERLRTTTVSLRPVMSDGGDTAIGAKILADRSNASD